VLKRYREIQKRREERESSERGFTLIELLIVIVVLGILAAIVIFSLTGVTGQSNRAACNADGKSIEIAADAYSAANGSYPTQSGDVVGTGSGTSGSYLQPPWPTVEGTKYTFSFGSNTVDLVQGTNDLGAYTTACAGL
jgi:prepilin-type N-terminal cleavage/methylation domain-containing protein